MHSREFRKITASVPAVVPNVATEAHLLRAVSLWNDGPKWSVRLPTAPASVGARAISSLLNKISRGVRRPDKARVLWSRKVAKQLVDPPLIEANLPGLATLLLSAVSRQEMRRVMVVMVATLAASRSHAIDCSANAIVRSSVYSACHAATMLDFTVAANTAILDPAVFCASADCVSLWNLLQRLGALQCFQRYNAGNYTLQDELSAESCFKMYTTPTRRTITTDREASTTTKRRRTSDVMTTVSSGVASAPVHKTVDIAEGSRHGQPAFESATIGTSNTSALTSSEKATPPASSVTIKADSDLQGTSLSAVWIALASCGGGVVLLVLVSIYIRRRKAVALEAKVLECHNRSCDYVQTTHTSRSQRQHATHFIDHSAQHMTTKPSPRLVCFDDDILIAVRIPYGKLTMGSLVSRGGFGEVYRGMYRNKAVAIKRLLPEKRHDVYQIENFLDEIKLMASLEHDHIVQFVGVAWETVEELCCVTEFLALGDLRTLLAKFDMDDDAHPKGFTTDKLKIALHVAKALAYMHALAPSVLHRDIKSRNILLDAKLDAKVTDFGVSRERAESTMTTGVGSTLWMAPEVMSGGRYNEKADIFSFGVVLSELDTHRIPYAHVVEPRRGRQLPETVIVQMMMMNRIRVQFTDDPPSPMVQLGRRCVHLDPAERPSAKEIEDFMEAQWRNGGGGG